MTANTVSILDGNTFVVSDLRGDINASPTDPTGLFSLGHTISLPLALPVNGKPRTHCRPTISNTSQLNSSWCQQQGPST